MGVLPAAVSVRLKMPHFPVIHSPGAVSINMHLPVDHLIIHNVIPRAVSVQGGLSAFFLVFPGPGAVGVSGHNGAVGGGVRPRPVRVHCRTCGNIFHLRAGAAIASFIIFS